MPPAQTKGLISSPVQSSMEHANYVQCDRSLPCSNCISRGTTDVCQYESETTILKRHSQSGETAAPTSSEGDSPADINRRQVVEDIARLETDSAAQQLSALGYTKSNGMNTLGFVEKIQSHGRDGRMQVENIVEARNGLREKYKNLIRQLPSRSYIDQLIDTYFREINWHYCSLDRHAFDQHLHGWVNLSFSVLNKGPQELPANLRFFPALLFQMLALALQFHNPGQDSSLDCLKYVKEMTLDDLASDYSESGADILKLLGKRDLTLVTVQAGFLRTSFLKNSGNIPESWHSLSATIRDAQEISLHKSSTFGSSHHSPEKALEELWHIEDRRRMWMILSTWDPHMAIVLGRPTTIDCRDQLIALPVDVPPGIDRRTSGPIARSNDDAPTPLTMMLVTAKGISLLKDILALETEGPCPRDYAKVEKLHAEVLNTLGALPAYFRSENPDTSFDSRPDCYWLPESRPMLDTSLAFGIMSLHRPYVFTIAKSRMEALKAGLSILRAQRRFFQHLQAKHYKMFNLVLSTFDAIVLVAAIYIMCPQDNPELLSDSLQHFEWAMERFETMSERNQMAKAALGVLQAIHVRLMKVLGRRGTKRRQSPQNSLSPIPSSQHRTASTTSNYQSGSVPSRGSSVSGTSTAFSSTTLNHTPLPSHNEYHNIQPDLGAVQPSLSGIPDQVSTYQTVGEAWPPNYQNPLVPGYDGNGWDLGNMAPLQPLHDLLFNDLVGMSDASAPTVAANASTFYDAGVPWKFEGGFETDSFWNFMNQYHNP